MMKKVNFIRLVFVGLFCFFCIGNHRRMEYFRETEERNRVVEIELCKKQANEVFEDPVVSQNELKTTTFPSFNHVTTSDSMCHPDSNNRTKKPISDYCENVNCMDHEKDVDDDLLVSLKEDAIEDDSEGCKMLWFAAVHESDKICETFSTFNHAYNVDY